MWTFSFSDDLDKTAIGWSYDHRTEYERIRLASAGKYKSALSSTGENRGQNNMGVSLSQDEYQW